MYEARGEELIIPSNKFFPPHVSKEQSLLRENLLTTKLPSSNHKGK